MAPLLVAALAPGVAFADTLDQALAKAYNSNPRLLAERARLRAIDEAVPQALSNWRPTVTLTAEAGITRTDSATTTPHVRTTEPTTADITVTQPLYRGGRTTAETARAENEVRAARARLSSVEQGVLLSGTRAYVDVFRDLAVVELNIKNVQRVRRQLQATGDRFRVGEVTRTDVSQAEARLARATADRVQAEGNLISSRAIYRNIIGEAPGELAQPTLKDLPASETEAQELAGGANPDVIAAEFDEKAARDDIKVIHGELLPELNVKGTLSASDEASSPTSSRNRGEIMAELTIPLYQAGDVYSRLRETKEVASQRRQQVHEARRNAIEAAARAWESLSTARARVRAFQEEVRANEIALIGVETEALVGTRIVLDILDAEQELLDAEVNLVRSQRDEIIAGHELKLAVGRLTAVHLGLPVKIYDFEGNYRSVRDRWFGAPKGSD
ncbi:MAG: TolC family outer membrane protein [Proteobacteria bacterium]|nr:TolC family outer membrane protein [Pseudomonadota bacterium]